MRTDGGALYTQIEDQLPNFVQTNYSKFSKFVEKYSVKDTPVKKPK